MVGLKCSSLPDLGLSNCDFMLCGHRKMSKSLDFNLTCHQKNLSTATDTNNNGFSFSLTLSGVEPLAQ